MLDIGEVRQEFAVSMANSLMNSRVHVLEACVEIYQFSMRSDVSVSTLATASQVERELRSRHRQGDKLSKNALKFLKHYKSATKHGRSIFFAPQRKEGRRTLLEQASEHGAFQPLNALH